MRQLVGLLAPLPTPYTDDGSSVGEIRLARLMGWLRMRRVAGFAVCTDSGEYTVLSLQERKQVAEIAIREAHGIPVVVNVTAVATTAALDLAQHAAHYGAIAGILAPPCTDFTDDEVYGHFTSIASHSSIPLIVVDPRQRLTDKLTQDLRRMPTLSFPNPAGGLAALRGDRTCTDEFSFPEAVVSPVAAFAPQALLPSAQPTIIPSALRSVGTARLVKAALAHQGIELGPMRGPYQPLPPSYSALLDQCLDVLNHAA